MMWIVLAVFVALLFAPRRILGPVKMPLIIGVIVAGFILLPAWTFNPEPSDEPVYDPATITDYRAHFRVTTDGDLTVIERLTVDFPVPLHGIFRFFDIVDPTSPRARRIPHDLRVTRDGNDEPTDLTRRNDGRFRVVRIGSPDRTLDGQHVYEIRYRIRGALEPGTTGLRSQFYWNLIPSGWVMSISRSELTVDLPVAAPESVRCAVGAGATNGCAVDGEGTRHLRVTTGSLEPNTPVTVKTGLDLPTPPTGDALPWTARWDGVLGRNLVTTGIVSLLAVLAGAWGWLWRRRSWENDPAFPLVYAPPDGIGPGQGAYILNESVGRDQFVATLLQAAEKNAIDLERDGESWTLRRAEHGTDAELDSVTESVLKVLQIGKDGRLEIAKGHVKSGHTLDTAQDAFATSVASWAKKKKLVTPIPRVTRHGVYALFALLVAVVISVFNMFDMSLVAAIPGTYGAMTLGLLGGKSTTRRTEAGRRLWSEVGGFRRVLGSDSGTARFDFSGRKDLYTAYIPWAVAFGCADGWAKKYRTETGDEPPLPAYGSMAASGGDVPSISPAALTASFGAAVGAAIGAYSASIATSSSSSSSSSFSSSGGGFSGGGGGGGGGGGSW
jgi:uncharacterized membrane protein YgcG